MNRILLPPLAFFLVMASSSTGRATEPNSDQASAIAEIEKLGGMMTVDEESPGRPVVEVRWIGREGTDAGLANLKGLMQLRSLRVEHSQVTDVGLAQLKGLSQLQSLDLSYTQVTDAGLEHLAGLTKLRSLNLEWNHVTDTGLVHLKRLTHLQSLNLMNTKISGAGLAHLSGLAKLQELNLEWDPVNDAGLVQLQALSQLQALNLNGTQITDSGLEQLKGLTRLQSLDLTRTKVADAGLGHLKDLTKLQILDLDGTKVTDAGLSNLKPLIRLKDLNLNSTKVTDAGLKHLARLTGLQRLCLVHTSVTDAGLLPLKGLSKLQLLDLHKTQVTNAGLVHLEGLSNLQSLDLDGTKVTHVGVKTLQQTLPKCEIVWNPPQLPVAAEIRKWNDEHLRAALEERELGREDKVLLLEVVRRGGDGWKKYLTVRHDALMQLIESPLPDPSGKRYFERWSLSNLTLLTALRRIEKKADPLRILVAGKLKQTYSLEEKPRFKLLLTNLDVGKETVHGFTNGGNYRSGRLARWRFEVRDEKGRILPIISPFGFMGGGISTMQTLAYNESWAAELSLRNYVTVVPPGKYTLRVFYHNCQEIVDLADIGDLITCSSDEIQLEVTPIRVWVSDNERREARKWISELPDTGAVKMAIGIVEAEKFLDPKSPAGRLQRMYTQAIPDLIDAALDSKLRLVQRAWVLAMLFAITGHNDPRGWLGFEGSEIIGSYEAEDANGGSSSCSGGKIDVKKQQAFAEKWRVWKTDHYYIVDQR